LPSPEKIAVKNPELHQGVTIENVYHSYGKFQALKNINFQAYPGEVCAILGPNGAGKTTLMRLITGFFMPTEGNIWLSDVEMTKDPLKAKQLMGYLPERFPLYSYLTVNEFLRWCLDLRGFHGNHQDEVNRVLKTVKLEERIRSRIEKLSKGMRQRVALAQALLGDVPYLVLDEPTSGLDPKQILGMRDLIHSLKGTHTILISTHILAEAAQVADRIIILSEGRVVAKGKPEDLARAYLEGEMIYRLGFTGKKEEIESALKSLTITRSVEWVDVAGDRLHLELRVVANTDETTLFTALAKVKLKPFEFFRKDLKLEDVFVKAITQDPTL